MKADEQNLDLELKKAHELIKKLQSDLEVQRWSAEKTNEKYKKLYREVEDKKREFEKLDFLKSEFVSTVSHELRTPLAIIRESVAQILEGLVGEVTNDQQAYLQLALESIDRLSHIINDLLDISKIEAGRIEIVKSLINVVSLVQKVAKSFQLKVEQKGLKLEVVAPEGVIKTFADHEKLIQVLTNLIVNALKFTVQGTIQIKVEEKNNHIECRVQDTGKGIAPEDLPKVFGKFQQFGRTHGPGEKGTGLGLAISKGIVEIHGGQIWVESEWEKGSSFIFQIPKLTPDEFILQSTTKGIEAAIRHQSALSLIFFGIRNFKPLCVKMGEEKIAGWMHEFWQITQTNLRRKADVAVEDKRSICVVLPETDKENAILVGWRIRKVLQDHLVKQGLEKQIILGLEVTGFPDDDKAAEKLIGLAQGRLSAAKKVLVVDDEPNVISLIERHLKREDRFICASAPNGVKALEKIQEDMPDLIVLDIMMPEMNGYEVVGRLKGDKKTRHIPIVILSAIDVEKERMENLASCSIPVVSKTDGFQKLIEVINSTL